MNRCTKILNNQKNILRQENGMVSIIVTMLIMIVLTIIVLGFAQLARREQRQALDRQLNTQAFYAAESGINDAYDTFLGKTTGIDSCYGADEYFSNDLLKMNPKLDGSAGIGYTCLLVDPSPPYLDYNPVGSDTTVARITNTNLSKIRISWVQKDGNTGFKSSGALSFPPETEWGSGTGVLRLSLSPLNIIDRSHLINNTFTAFLYPNSGAIKTNGTSDYSASLADKANQGQIISGKCNINNKPSDGFPLACNVDITSLTNKTKGFMLAFRSIYTDSHVIIKGYVDNGAGGYNETSLTGAQMLVDSTGKANDVIRRVKVRLPMYNNSNLFPNAAVWSTTDFCKRIIIHETMLQEDNTTGCSSY